MEREPVNYATFAFKVYEREKELNPQPEHDLNHYLMRIVSAIGRASSADDSGVAGPKIDYQAFNEDIIGPDGFSYSYKKHIKGSLQDKFAEVAIRIFVLMGARGIKVSMFDNMNMNIAPMQHHVSSYYKTLNELLYELVSTITHRKEQDYTTLELLRAYEKNPEDKELDKLIDEQFGEIEFPEDIELRTVYGFQNYMVTMPLMTILSVLSSWFKSQGGRDMAWHINARMYYKSNL